MYDNMCDIPSIKCATRRSLSYLWQILSVWSELNSWPKKAWHLAPKFGFPILIQCGGYEGPVHQQKVLRTPSGCPRIQLNSGTTYLKITSDSTGQGFSLIRLPHPTPRHTHFRCQKEAQVNCASEWLATDWRLQGISLTKEVNHKPSLSPVLLPEWL